MFCRFVSPSQRRTDQTDDDLYNLSPNLPLCAVTDTTQKTGPTVVHADFGAPSGQHELDCSEQEYICPQRFRSLNGNRLSHDDDDDGNEDDDDDDGDDGDDEDDDDDDDDDDDGDDDMMIS